MKKNLPLVLAVIVCVAVVIGFLQLRSKRNHLEQELQRVKIAEEAARREHSATATRLSDRDAELEKLRQDAAEVHRLRGEIRKLKAQLDEFSEVRRQNNQLRDALSQLNSKAASADLEAAEAAEEAAETEAFQALTMAKMNFAKQIGLGLFYNRANPLPADPGQIQVVIPDDLAAMVNADQFEMMYTGRLDELTEPARTIIMREKEAVQSPDGRWVRTYLFGDGHSETYRDPGTGFEAWERDRTVRR